MRWLPVIARVLMGLVFVGAGIAGFASKFATPPDLPPNLLAFTQGMAATVYFMPFLKATEIACGLMLLSGFFVPLALVILAPIILHIFMVHSFMAPEGLPLAVILGVLEIYLAFFSPQYSPTIKALFKKK